MGENERGRHAVELFRVEYGERELVVLNAASFNFIPFQ